MPIVDQPSIDRGIVELICHAPVAERLDLIERILRSLKNDVRGEPKPQPQRREFVVRRFSLGGEVEVDRDEIYADRVP